MDNFPNRVLSTLLELKGESEGGVEKSSDAAEELENTISTGFIVVLLMLMFYMSAGAVIEKYHVTFGHEASATVLMGKSYI